MIPGVDRLPASWTDGYRKLYPGDPSRLLTRRRIGEARIARALESVDEDGRRIDEKGAA